MRGCLHSSIALRPAAVILTRTTSIALPPAITTSRSALASPRRPHRLGEIFAANVWVTIFPFCTMKVSVPSSKRLSAVSALHTM
jgi:hypothetical protein